MIIKIAAYGLFYPRKRADEGETSGEEEKEGEQPTTKKKNEGRIQK